MVEHWRANERDGLSPILEHLFEPSQVTVSAFDEVLFGLAGTRISVDVSGAMWRLDSGTYWINIQPVAWFGDIYYLLRDLDTQILNDAHATDGDLAFGQYGWGILNWQSLGDHGLGYGPAAMKIEGVPEPATTTLLALSAAVCLGRPR